MTDTILTDDDYARPSEAGVGDFVALLKPRVMSLVVFSGLAGLLVAPGSIHPFLGAVAILCIAVGSGASGAINMWYDRDIDAVMSRTRDRPVVTGRIDASEALAFGVVLAALSVGVMAIAVNFMAAGLLLAAILFYVFIYTMWLKRRTSQNIVIGGAAGAFPPMIGWAAVTGDISLESVVLFALIFFWTPPHFWALALYKCGDYARAGVPMLPVVAGERHTKWQMLVYTVLLLPLSLVPWYMGMAGIAYAATALVCSGIFVAAAIAVLRDVSLRSARAMFGFSIFYLFALFAALILDRAQGWSW